MGGSNDESRDKVGRWSAQSTSFQSVHVKSSTEAWTSWVLSARAPSWMSGSHGARVLFKPRRWAVFGVNQRVAARQASAPARRESSARTEEAPFDLVTLAAHLAVAGRNLLQPQRASPLNRFLIRYEHDWCDLQEYTHQQHGRARPVRRLLERTVGHR